jgi:hypothetical protein
MAVRMQHRARSAMFKWLAQLDRLLRGETTRPELLREGRMESAGGGLAAAIVLLGMLYGLCMGSYSLLKVSPTGLQDSAPRYLQLVATTIKVPALFYLTLFVTFPSLYVFNALVGSRLSMINVLRLLLASLAVNLAVLASLGPIVLFFSVSTTSYAFILLLNVMAFTVAGVLGLAFLLQTLNRMTAPWRTPDATEFAPQGEIILTGVDEPSALDMPSGQSLRRHTRLVFGCWVVVFALVGAQMGWVLRPFVGSPSLPFSWLRPRQSNFFEAIINSLQALFSS